MITFNSRNIDGNVREWDFESVKELEDTWKSPDADVPANDDPIWNVKVDGASVWVGNPEDVDEGDEVWFEDLLTYCFIEIWG